MTVWSVQGGSMGVLPGHVADNLQRSGASSGPDEGLKVSHWTISGEADCFHDILSTLNVSACCECDCCFLIYCWGFTVYLSATLLLQLHELFQLTFCEFKSSLSQQKHSRPEQSMCVVLNLTTLSSMNRCFHGNLVYIKVLMLLRESLAVFCPTSTHHPWPLWLVSHRTSLHQCTGATSITLPQPVSHVTRTFSHTCYGDHKEGEDVCDYSVWFSVKLFGKLSESLGKICCVRPHMEPFTFVGELMMMRWRVMSFLHL